MINTITVDCSLRIFKIIHELSWYTQLEKIRRIHSNNCTSWLIFYCQSTSERLPNQETEDCNRCL